MLQALGWLAALAVIASELPVPVSVPLAVLAIGYGLRLARHQRHDPTRGLLIPLNNDTAATIDGIEAGDLQVQWRGPLAFLQWRQADGRIRHLHGWPDNLDAAARRELRLAMAARTPARLPRSVAP